MPKPENILSRAEEVELRYKELLIADMEDRINDRRDKLERARIDRQRQYDDFLKSEAVRTHRQTVCKHRKGGKNNIFWNGDATVHSIIHNTYPTGQECIMCTRCGKETWKPPRLLRQKDPEKYKALWAEWKEWVNLPTDNTPSGSKMFEVYTDAAQQAAVA